MQFLTSWDDGYALDLRVADLLDRYGLTGTFYVSPAVQHGTQMLSREEIRHLSARHTIGAHSMTHPKLTEIAPDAAKIEIEESKRWVEDIIAKPCTTFCYPYGAVNAEIAAMVKTAGFTDARTTSDLQFSSKDPYQKPISLQISPFPLRRRFHPAWKMLDPLGPLRCRFRRLRSIGIPLGAMTSWLGLAKALLTYAQETDQPFFHLYGHSREMEKYGMWGELEEVLKFAGDLQ